MILWKVFTYINKRVANENINNIDLYNFLKSFAFSYFSSLNLYELIKKNNYQGFSLSLIRRFCNSIIKCLRLLYHEKIIHCDLKPVS